MKRTLLLPLFLLLCITAMAQPPSYVRGTQVCWNFNGRDHGYFKAAGNGERHILISFTGNGETNCTNYQNTSPQKWLNDAGLNWDGRTVRAPGDTVIWEVFTIPNNSYVATVVEDLNYFFTHIGPIDTTDRSKFHIEGLSGGVSRQWEYMTNSWGLTSPYRHVFSTTISQSTTWLSSYTLLPAYSTGRRHWVWHGTADANGNTPPSASTALYNALNGTKYLTMQTGGGHNSATWDSCMSLKGSDTLTNRWLWMVRKKDTVPSDTVVIPPFDTCVDVGGGPAGYVPGTQVTWHFNGRSHGYFRAKGCGERHILIAFTGNGETDSTNYQTNSPQKLLRDAGTNWDGRTVRAPGDTVVWEVFTIPNNTYTATAVDDINYFFTHIAAIDTSKHRLFHITGVSGGASRQWDYLINPWNLTSPYCKIFSTTFSVSTTWLSNYSLIEAYSTGRRHWVWHGAADANGNTPPSASTGLYGDLNGEKHLTLQAGGGHNAATWDSAFSILGTDSSTNRWIWMVTADTSSSGLLRQDNALSYKKEIAPQKSFKLYPNPAAGFVTVDFEAVAGVNYRATVIDVSGSVVHVETNVKSSGHKVDVSGLRQGIYILQLEGGGTKVQQKFIKE